MTDELDYRSGKGDDDKWRGRLSVIGGIFGMLAALACAWQLLWLIGWELYGAPPNPLHGVAMLGAAVLFFSSIGMLATRRRGAAVATVVAVVPMWVFFGPALFYSLGDIGEIVLHLEVFDVLLFVPSLLLLTTTVLAVLRMKQGG